MLLHSILGISGIGTSVTHFLRGAFACYGLPLKNHFISTAGVCSQRTIRRASGANDDSYSQGERKMKIYSSLLCVSLLALTMSLAFAQQLRLMA
jgi:hypothetical protein